MSEANNPSHKYHPMRGNIIDLLLAEAKRKPAIKALVDKIHELTDEDIAQAQVPLPWYRQALVCLKEKDSLRTLALDVDKHIVHGAVPNPDGEVFQWVGGEAYLPSGPFGSLLMITHGKLLWLPAKGGVWYETSFSPTVHHSIRANCRKLCDANKLEYMEMYKRATSRNAPADVPVIDMSDTPQSPLAAMGVRIYR
jgi:hypothetical protein